MPRKDLERSMAFGQWLSARLEGNEKKDAIATLDGVRAVACLLVIWFHIDLISRDTHIWDAYNADTPLFSSVMFMGNFGVTLFFVLSGFLLFMPYAKSLLFDQKWPSARRFYTRRVFRIVPAYYLALILLVLIYQRQYLQPAHWGELGLFFTFFMDSSQATYQQLNGPFWTLAVEWQYYLLLPLLVLLMRVFVRRVAPEKRLLATLLCLVLLVYWGVFSRSWGWYYQWHPSQTWLVPRPALNWLLVFIFGQSGKYLEDFAIGMLLSLLFIYAQHPSTSPKVQHVLRRLSPWLWSAGVLSLVFLAMWNYNIRNPHSWPLLDNLTPYFSAYIEVLFASAFGLCILAILYGSGGLVRLFAWLPLRRLGLISFSLYIWHLPLLLIFMVYGHQLLSNIPGLLAYGLYWLWVAIIVIPACFLFYLLVEKAGMKLGERLQRREVKSPATTPVPQVHAEEREKAPVR